jgi:hypothetical protein
MTGQTPASGFFACKYVGNDFKFARRKKEICMTRTAPLRIGNAGGYWGDDPHALKRQIFGGQRLDYITIDFLAEVTMSIMQKQRARDPQAGYARDFIAMLAEVLPRALADKTRIITNAGGVNPAACAEAIQNLAKKMGLKPKIALVYGDDILNDIDALKSRGAAFKNMESGEDFSSVSDRLEAANIYFGAAPVVEALKWNPDIIITGRVTDTGITVAPMIHEFGWSLRDWDKIAHGIIAGHMLECGSQVTGGNFTDWQKVESFHEMGYPIAEVSPDGSFIITKHEGSGGLVSTDTVREQTFYEMGNPKAYLTPDVVADFSTIRLEAAGKDRVRVSGIKGYEPTTLYKVSMAFRDGFKAVGSIAICGPDARKKAEAFARIFWARVGTDFDETSTEYYGWNACHQSLGHALDGNEILLKLGARSSDEGKLRTFGKMIPSLILGGPPGVAVIGGVPKNQEVVSYWPALMEKTLVEPKVALFDNGLLEIRTVSTGATGSYTIAPDQEIQVAEAATESPAELHKDFINPKAVALVEICLGRSGDKGDMANVGIMARSERAFEFLDKFLTAQKMKNYFQEICSGRVVRYKLPGLTGFNFLLEESLGGGGTKTLRTDAQGKTFAQAVLRQKTLIPEAILSEIHKFKK